MGTLLLGHERSPYLEDGQRVSYSLMGPRGNQVVESFFSRFNGKTRDLFLEAKTPEGLKGAIAERIANYHEGRLHSGPGYRALGKALREALGASHSKEAKRAHD